MCLIAFAWQYHPAYRLVLAGNRDEFHERASAPLERWRDAPDVLAGRDLVAMGTWLGLSERGRLAAVTNVRLPGSPPPNLRSRGQLASGFLLGPMTPAAHAQALLPELHEYSGCNLLMFDPGTAVFATNQPQVQTRTLEAGLYGLSNASLDTPWPKTVALRDALGAWLADPTHTAAEPDFEPLFRALANPRQPRDAELPDTGVGIERERFVAPAFIRSTIYGTRCSTVIAIGYDGQGMVVERRFGPDGVALGESRLPFRWPES
jgi:uncharacterized protein with NRDE domain